MEWTIPEGTSARTLERWARTEALSAEDGYAAR
jgi:hypothetical protein